MRNILTQWILSLICCLLIACGSIQVAGNRSENIQVSVVVHYRGVQCFLGHSGPKVDLLNNKKELDAFFKQNAMTTLGGSKDNYPNIDFSKNAVVAIWAGKKPTAGYQLDLDKQYAQIISKTARLSVTLIKPSAGAIAAQVITSPCLIVTLPRGGYDAIEVVSQKNNSLGRVSLQSPISNTP